MIEYKKGIKHSTSLVFSVFFLFCVATAATAQTPQQTRNAFQSTVALEMELANGNRVPLGSGFYLMTLR